MLKKILTLPYLHYVEGTVIFPGESASDFEGSPFFCETPDIACSNGSIFHTDGVLTFNSG